MLGAVQPSVDGAECSELVAQPKRLGVLIYLAASTPVGLCSRDKLVDMFWPELDHEHARNALSQALHFIRHCLDEGVLVTRGRSEVGLTEGFRCDVREFDAAIQAGRLAAALDLYRGEFLSGFHVANSPEFDDWVLTRRAHLRSTATDSATTLATSAEAAGRLVEAAHWFRRALGISPFNERILRQLLWLLDRLGDRGAAAAAYQQFADRLARKLDVQPSPETKRLMARVRGRSDR
jgi:DNA-binding SARP family transcriptional activator